MDDLRFRLENMDRHGERLELMLTTLLGSIQVPGTATHNQNEAENAPGTDNAPATSMQATIVSPPMTKDQTDQVREGNTGLRSQPSS
jgi:hypothetical protein